MMERNFYSDDFEQLIREKTEQYKMYPSEKVWKGVHGSLHTKRRWFIIGMSLLVTGILFFAAKELIAPSNRGLIAKKITATNIPAADNTRTEVSEENAPAPILRGYRTASATAPAGKHNGQEQTDAAEDQPYKGITITISHLVISQPDLSEFLSRAVRLPAEIPSLPVIAVKPAAAPEERTLAANGGTSFAGETSAGSESGSDAEAGRTDVRLAKTIRNNHVSSNKNLAVTRSVPDHAADQGALKDSAGKTLSGKVKFSDAIADQQRSNWLADYAVYNLDAAPKRNRKFLQLYLTPTINTRTLSGGTVPPKSIYQIIPDAILGSSKNYVDHSPSLGFQVGALMQYRVTRNLTVKAGLQFSYSRYNIQAYAYNSRSVMTPPNSYYGYCLDSTGKSQTNLSNNYYQLAAPVGFELRIMGNERLQLNLGATIQPTYLLNRNSFLLNTDYTNYIKDPALLRRWNVNGQLEAFLSYRTRSGLRWQIGPEFRYQLLSTYDNQYPIREHQKGYGLKIGIVKPLP